MTGPSHHISHLFDRGVFGGSFESLAERSERLMISGSCGEAMAPDVTSRRPSQASMSSVGRKNRWDWWIVQVRSGTLNDFQDLVNFA